MTRQELENFHRRCLEKTLGIDREEAIKLTVLNDAELDELERKRKRLEDKFGIAAVENALASMERSRRRFEEQLGLHCEVEGEEAK